jgi:competence protein ComEC
MADSRGRARAGAASAARPDLAHVLAGRWRESRPALADAIWLFPWLAVAFGVGIGLAFAADGPLSSWAPLIGGLLAAGAALVVRGRPVPLAIILALAMAFFGFLATVMRMAMVEAPILTRLTIGSASGFVESLEERGSGGRLVLVNPKLDGVAAERWPARIRVSTRSLAGIKPGDYVKGTMRLLPLPEASWPGGYDFARDAYFRGIGAVGSVSGRLATIDPPVAPSLALRVAAGIDRARNALTARIAETIGGQAGAVAAALITGKRGLIDEQTNDILRAAGIYHVVSNWIPAQGKGGGALINTGRICGSHPICDV